VAAAPDFKNMLQQVADAKAHVVVIDPGRDTDALLQWLQEAHRMIPGLKVVVIDMEPDLQTFLRFVRVGVVGYVLRDVTAADLTQAVLCVASGLAVCPAELCMGLFQYVADQSRQAQAPSRRPQFRLTNRERQLLNQVRLGSTNKEIAAELNLSEQTVKNHMHRILRKLGVPDRLAAAEMWSS
jgi:DNA-binding NarL/FixJ family response regulator